MYAQNFQQQSFYPNINFNSGGYPNGYPPQMPQYGMGFNPYSNPSYGYGYNIYQPTPDQFNSPNSPFIAPPMMNNPQQYQQPQQQAPIPLQSLPGNNVPASFPPVDPETGKPWGELPDDFQEYVPGRNINVVRSDGTEVPINLSGGVVSSPTSPYYDVALNDMNNKSREERIAAQFPQNNGNNQFNYYYQGGYNPVTNTITPDRISLGLNNPYNNYNYIPQQRQFYANNGYYNNFLRANPNPYLQTQFDQAFNELLYDAPIEAFDVQDYLGNIILTDEERERKRQRENFGYYNNYYFANMQYQQYVEKERENQRTIFALISRNANHALGKDEDFDMDKAKDLHDPMRFYFEQQRRMQAQQNDWYNNPDKREYAAQIQRVEEVKSLAAYEVSPLCEFEKQNRIYKVTSKIEAIRNSHCKVMGLDPNKSYTLSEYMDNAGAIISANNIADAYRANRKRKLQYNPVYHAQSISKETNRPVPVTKDDIAYASDDRLAMNKMMQINHDMLVENMKKSNVPKIMVLPDGSFSYAIAPPGEKQEDYERRKFEDALGNKHQKVYGNNKRRN